MKILRQEKLKKQFTDRQCIELDIFKGKTFWINGRTEPPQRELKGDKIISLYLNHYK